MKNQGEPVSNGKGKIYSAAILLSLSSVVHSQDQSIFAPDVFNWRFYLNAHSDLLMAGVVDAQGAKAHWQNFGTRECRRAHPNFHTSQYLNRYADLKAAFGQDCTKALNHYLTFGRNEGRAGLNGTYYIGPHGARVTVKNNIISVGLSSRTAGAIDSLYHNGWEYINSYDRGRQLQVAWTVNGTGECNNPTEAGSNSDGIGHNSSSNWTYRSESPNTAHTTSFPAFWLKPHERTDCNNVQQLAGHKLTKHVAVGAPGVSDRLIELISEVTIPAATNHLIVENPALYLAPEFNNFYSFNPADCKISLLAGAGPEQGRPVIASVSGGLAAVGLWSPDLPSSGFSTVGYVRSVFASPRPIDSTVKLNAVYRRSNVPAGTHLQQTYAAVGSLEQTRVALCQAVATFD
ncbi:MAG: hypothetical protein ACREPE_06325 [Lysobacter sp.]